MTLSALVMQDLLKLYQGWAKWHTEITEYKNMLQSILDILYSKVVFTFLIKLQLLIENYSQKGRGQYYFIGND